MKARLLPIDENVLNGAFALMANAVSHASFAPTRASSLGGAVDATLRAPRVGFWERLDRWAWRQVQKERDAYLARSQNLADLEQRIRNLDCVRGRYF